MQDKLVKFRWPFLGLIVGMMAVVLIIAPEEQTIGAGIRPVYLHVSLTWNGMLGMLAAAIAGIVLLIKPSEGKSSWFRTIFTVALVIFSLGLIVSMIASYVNWGNVPFREPKVLSVMRVLVVGWAAWILMLLVSVERVKAVLGIIPVWFMYFGIQSSRLVLHPDNPVASSPVAIRATFLSMFFLSLLFSIWLAWSFRLQAVKAK